MRDYQEAAVANHCDMVQAGCRGTHTNTVRRITEDARRADTRRRRSSGITGLGSRNPRVTNVSPALTTIGCFVDLARGVSKEIQASLVGSRAGCSNRSKERRKPSVDSCNSQQPMVLLTWITLIVAADNREFER